jgi:hypothetical protein
LLETKPEEDGRNMYWDSILFRWKHTLVTSLPASCTTVSEIHSTQYSPLPPVPPNGLFMKGYFQSSKYFQTAKQELQRLMSPSPILQKEMRTNYAFLLAATERIVVIHARRTDYLKNDWNIAFHGPLSTDYYKEAIDEICKIVKKPYFLLCSDDPTYWFQTIPKLQTLQDNPIHILQEDDIHTMALLQMFQYFILANSSFSWWSAWLANAKHCIVPKHWFGPKGPSYYEDIYEEHWQKI